MAHQVGGVAVQWRTKEVQWRCNSGDVEHQVGGVGVQWRTMQVQRRIN